MVLLGHTTGKKAGHILDTFLDLGRNLVADNVFQATFQSVRQINSVLQIYFAFLSLLGSNSV